MYRWDTMTTAERTGLAKREGSVWYDRAKKFKVRYPSDSLLPGPSLLLSAGVVGRRWESSSPREGQGWREGTRLDGTGSCFE